MSVLRYYVCITLYSDPCGPWLVISDLYLILSLVLCCDIHRSTLISIMYPACMITVHDRKSRALQLSSPLPPSAATPPSSQCTGEGAIGCVVDVGSIIGGNGGPIWVFLPPFEGFLL